MKGSKFKNTCYAWMVRQNYCNKTNEMHQFLKFVFGIELYTFRTGFLSIFRSLVLYIQQ